MPETRTGGTIVVRTSSQIDQSIMLKPERGSHLMALAWLKAHRVHTDMANRSAMFHRITYPPPPPPPPPPPTPAPPPYHPNSPPTPCSHLPCTSLYTAAPIPAPLVICFIMLIRYINIRTPYGQACKMVRHIVFFSAHGRSPGEEFDPVTYMSG